MSRIIILVIFIYTLISLAVYNIHDLFFVIVLGPTKSLGNLFDGIIGLGNPRYNIPDANNYIYVGIIIHAICWILFPVLCRMILHKRHNVRKTLLISTFISWPIGALVNFSWEVLSNI